MIVGPPSSRPSTLAGQRRAGAAELLEEDRRLGQRRAAAAVLARPVRRRPAAVVQAALAVAPPRVVARPRACCGSGPGSLAASQARSSSRNAVSRSEKVRSIGFLPRWRRRPRAGDRAGQQGVGQRLGVRDPAGAQPRADELVDAGGEHEQRVVAGQRRARRTPANGRAVAAGEAAQRRVARGLRGRPGAWISSMHVRERGLVGEAGEVGAQPGAQLARASRPARRAPPRRSAARAPRRRGGRPRGSTPPWTRTARRTCRATRARRARRRRRWRRRSPSRRRPASSPRAAARAGRRRARRGAARRRGGRRRARPARSHRT